MSRSIKETSDLQKIMERIRNHAELYAVMSMCTHMPFVYCDPESYDDEIFLYFSKEEANQGVRWLLEEKNPIQLAKVDVKDRLAFFTSLYPMGVNAISVNHGLTKQISFQLNELIRRQEPEQMPKEQIRIENPELHLTSLYFSQELKKNPGNKGEMSEELKALNEELIAHFKEGKYIVAVEGEKKIPILQKEGMSYLPLFTDLREFQKFNKKKTFGAMVVEYENITKLFSPETEGIVINPFGVDIVLKITTH
ncbi:MAG: SseB family protein [Lachnospiraceae bacterium]